MTSEPKEKTKGPMFRVEDRRIAKVLEENPDAFLEEIVSLGDGKQYPSFVEELKIRCETAEKRLQEKIQWMEQEISRTRERILRDHERKLESEKQAMANLFLEVADHFELALESIKGDVPILPAFLDGLMLIRNSFHSKLQILGIKPLDLNGKPFDPNLCEALTMEEVSQPEADNTVVRVVLPGYTMGEQLLRPAKVIVGRYSGRQSCL
jgi:molecular chaperone GrpE